MNRVEIHHGGTQAGSQEESASSLDTSVSGWEPGSGSGTVADVCGRLQVPRGPRGPRGNGLDVGWPCDRCWVMSVGAGRVWRGWVSPIAGILALLLALITGPSGTGASLETRELFNGRDLGGWHSWLVDTRRGDPRGVFSVTNASIRISGDGLGYLATEREFENYHLVVEWRWGRTNTSWGDRLGRARDSGVFLHATGPDGNSHDGGGAFMAALECNVFQGATGDLLLIRGTAADGSMIHPRATAEVSDVPDPEGWFTWRSGGRPRTIERWGRINWFRKAPAWKDQFDFRGPHDLELPPGEWNQLECEALGDTLRFRLNGTLVNELRDVYPRRGRILLQCEGSEIFFRRVTLRSGPKPD